MKKLSIILALLISSVSFSQDILMQNGNSNQCAGTFTDSGGPANYSSNEDFTYTICPQNTGDILQLDFNSFSTQLTDVMTIYDGDDITAPVLGTFSGGGAANNPGLVEASGANATGCLTITFVSDGSVTTTGWSATISCFEPCQTITAVIDSTSPTVNGAGQVEADLNEVITFNGNGVFSNTGAGATYTWDFGDGTPTVTGQSVTHAYTTAGIFDVTLIITDTNPNGCSSTNNINLQVIAGASSPGNPSVDAGNDVSIDCTTGCVDITASYLDIGLTNTYNITPIVFVPPFSFNGLTNSVNTNVDDRWGSVENMPFDFCFFTNTETQFQVGSNGVIRFDVDASDLSNGYALGAGDNLPNNTNDTLGEANIFTPVHDIDPSVNNTNEIRWEIIGAAPNRVLAVSFFEVPLYSCNSLEATHMAVMYETTNVIDIYIRDSPACTTFNGGRAAVGIQNDAGNNAFVPPGRNVSDSPWTANDEAWRFTPAGPSVVEFAWLDDTGAVISTSPTFNVCPSSTTTYTARVTYTNCNGDIVIVTDDVVVSVPVSVDLGPDQNLCIGDPNVVLDATVASGSATYQWQLDGSDITGETNPTLTVSSPNSGTYSVSIVDAGCTVTDSVIITFSNGNAAFSLTPTCDGATANITGDLGGVFSFNPAPTDTAVIDAGTGTITNGVSGTSYTVEYTTGGSCSATQSETVTVIITDDPSFTLTPTCDGATANITGDAGGTFIFNPAATDAAVIDTATGTITNGTPSATYTIEY
ncbi:PKD domain-containing protein, partial [Lacinutrix sp.]|uniref:PKD domain-containing protein n=1 Tax=Lacinutrix sp. TaxID=1937692 RepID=UPI0035C86223